MRFVITAAFFLFIDIYAFQVVRTLAREQPIWKYIWWGSSVLVLIAFAAMILSLGGGNRPRPSGIFMWSLGVFIMVYVPKMVMLFPLLIEDFLRFSGWMFSSFVSKDEMNAFPSRRKFVALVALGLASIPFMGIVYGVWKGRYRYRVIDVEIPFPDLPESFDGFTILQVSDLHVGSFDNRDKVQYGVDLLNSQEADCLVFTGDMVNDRSDELDDWQEIIGQMGEGMPKFSILGNHDYGDYTAWPSAEAKKANLQSLIDRHAEMGFKLMLNENTHFERNGEKLYLAGVENWGKPPFPQHGDLQKATEGIPDNGFSILLSHDPSHYDLEVKNHPKNVKLTLSGHTHGMQFGIEIPGWVKWSPVKWRYPKWAGLYEEFGRYLYVNRGFGYLAFPGRVGIWPEITRIVLRRSN
jgi:hypothetical protein